LSSARSLSDDVIAVTVVTSDDDTGHAESLGRQWDEWDPGVPLRVLHAQYASVVDPIVEFVDEAKAARRCQVVVLVPVIIPTRLRYSILHNHMDFVLSTALRRRSDVVVARAQIPLDIEDDREGPGTAPGEPG
jgi:hypothetical protein